MLGLPSSTLFNRKIPKNKFYKKLQANNKIKVMFVEQVESIIWKHKLSKETIRLESEGDIQEIQIFEVKLKQKTNAQEILKSIDRAIPYPILYVLLFEDQVKLSMAYKERSKNDDNKFMVRSFHESEWQPARDLKFTVVQGLNLKAVYENIIRQLLTVQAWPEEELTTTLERQSLIDKLTRDVDRLESMIRREKQFNKKVELNIEQQRKRKELNRLLEN
jgi:hypothetical protein